MSDDDPDLASLIALLDDDSARTILTETSSEPRSATELAEHCDASLSTVTRRLNDLADAGLVEDRTRPRSDGHHDTVYAATLDRFEVRLRDGDLEFELDRTDRDAADELKDLWEKF